MARTQAGMTNRPFEIRRGGIVHRYSAPSKGIEMLRLDRELRPILDRWREAKRQNPKAWK